MAFWHPYLNLPTSLSPRVLITSNQEYTSIGHHSRPFTKSPLDVQFDTHHLHHLSLFSSILCYYVIPDVKENDTLAIRSDIHNNANGVVSVCEELKIGWWGFIPWALLKISHTKEAQRPPQLSSFSTINRDRKLRFNVGSNLIESLLNRDTLIDSSPKFDYLLELAHIDPIPPGIEEADFDLEEEIRLVENLSYDNSSPRPPEERNSENVDTIIESPSPSPIPVEDSDSHMEEIDLFLASDDSMPPGIENDDYDSEGDIRFLEELLSNDPLPLPEIESSNLDHFNDPSSPRPPPEPPDVEICFDVEPDTTVKNDF
ncbi:hypothetical protein Tco_0990098 [Tanacetum coccineum]|uniref:Uncharacterized protein n=1 Tax=Tanacetum coccineum TaxID=301880 RepID=A0ABQ5EW66_9ASTR